MAEVNLRINQRNYTIGCADGEEVRLQDLGQYLDQRVQQLVEEIGQVGEARLLLLAALMMTDDLATSRDEANRLQNEIGHLSESLRRSEGAQGLEQLAHRLEGIAVKLESA